MEAENYLRVRYSVYNFDQVPAYLIDEGEVEVVCEAEADNVGNEIIAEIEATHSHHGYNFLMSVVLENVTFSRYTSGHSARQIKVYAECL